MSKHSKSADKDWKLWIGIIIVVLIIGGIIIVALRSKMTPEETVNKFMYLIENKQYEEAKKLSTGNLEKLDIISNLNPSNLTFIFSEDKKEATGTLLENGIETTNMNLKLKKTLTGWKIDNYEVVTNFIDPQIIEDRLKEGKTVTDIQLLYWGQSNVSTKEKIAQYVKDNGLTALIFIETMKNKNYNKASTLYQPIVKTDLTVEELKEYNWDNYNVKSNFELITNYNCITIELDKKELWIYVAGDTIMNVKEKTN